MVINMDEIVIFGILAFILAIIVIFWWIVLKLFRAIFTHIKNPYIALIVAVLFLWFLFG